MFLSKVLLGVLSTGNMSKWSCWNVERRIEKLRTGDVSCSKRNPGKVRLFAVKDETLKRVYSLQIWWWFFERKQWCAWGWMKDRKSVDVQWKRKFVNYQRGTQKHKVQTLRWSDYSSLAVLPHEQRYVNCVERHSDNQAKTHRAWEPKGWLYDWGGLFRRTCRNLCTTYPFDCFHFCDCLLFVLILWSAFWSL